VVDAVDFGRGHPHREAEAVELHPKRGTDRMFVEVRDKLEDGGGFDFFALVEKTRRSSPGGIVEIDLSGGIDKYPEARAEMAGAGSIYR
jgi:hypothetical protein